MLEANQGDERQKLLERSRRPQSSKASSRTLPITVLSWTSAASTLLHITDLAWLLREAPSEILNVGDEVAAKVLKFDQEKTASRSHEAAWRRFRGSASLPLPPGTLFSGKVSNLTDYCASSRSSRASRSCALSEMDWTNKTCILKWVQLGMRSRSGCWKSMKSAPHLARDEAVHAYPWEDFGDEPQKGRQGARTIKSITDFGIFIGLPGGIDGLVHLSDLSWSLPGEEACATTRRAKRPKRGAVDRVERERISLGVKQREGDPYSSYLPRTQELDRDRHREIESTRRRP